jgi:hypothetical protein
LISSSSIKAIPQNAYGDLNGQTVFTHGVEFGLAKAASRDLQEATNAWLNAIGRENPNLRRAGDPRVVRMSQRTALATPLVNPSPLGGMEVINVYTAFLSDGNLFYYLTLVPEKEAPAYEEAFRQVGQSIRLN